MYFETDRILNFWETVYNRLLTYVLAHIYTHLLIDVKSTTLSFEILGNISEEECQHGNHKFIPSCQLRP